MAKDTKKQPDFELDPGRPQELGVEIPEGEVEIELEPGQDELPESDHYTDISSTLSEGKLSRIGRDLIEDIERDKESRSEWDSVFEKGLKELGLDRRDDKRSDPFPGASAVHVPLLAQACVEFQSRIMREVFPPSGPAKTIVVGELTPEKVAKSERVQSYTSWLLTVGMPEYRDETDKTFAMLPLLGSVFKKVYWRETWGRPVVEFVTTNDLIVPYSAKSLETTPRATHILRLHQHEVRANIAAGLWRDVPLPEPDESEISASRAKLDKIVGLQRPSGGEDDRYVIYECHCILDIGEGDAPYIVTVCSESGTVLSIRRNWDEDDEARRPIQWFTHYRFVPFDGFYGLGLLHLIGGISSAATGALRALMDSAAINNMPGGLKLKGAKVPGNELTVRPLQYTDIEQPPSGSQMKISDMVAPLPVNPPSTTLYQLLEFLVRSGEKFGSVTIEGLMNAKEQAPVGTAMAMIEQQSMVFSAVHARQHYSMAKELDIIRRTIHDFADDEIYVAGTQGEVFVLREDFDGSVVIAPVSDPSIFSQAQRVTQAQAALQLVQQAAAAGVKVDARSAFMMAAKAFQLPGAESLFPEQPEMQPKPLDPASEFRACLAGVPAKAFKGQNHMAHVQFLLVSMQDPTFGPAIQKAAPLIQSLVADHLSLQRIEEIEMAIGMPLPEDQSQFPPQVQFQLAAAQAQAAQAIAASRQPQQPQVDPAIMALAAETDRKRVADEAKAKLEAAKILQDGEIKREQIVSKERIEAAKILAQSFGETPDNGGL